MKDTQNKRTRKHNPLGVVALTMGFIYSIPLVVYLITRIPVTLTISIFLTPIAVISFITARINFWKSPAENVRITYYGHMCFRLDCDDQAVMIDPYQDGSVPGLKAIKGKVQKVLRTDDGPDAGGDMTVRQAKSPLPFAIEEFGTQDGRGRMYLLDNGAHRFVHLGGLACDLTEEQKEAFRGADVLMVPVGGKYTLNTEEAAELAIELCPDYVIPMHFSTDKYGFRDIGSGDMFVSELRSRWYLMKEELEERDGEDAEVPSCPVAVRLAAKNGRDKGYSSVEIRERENR